MCRRRPVGGRAVRVMLLRARRRSRRARRRRARGSAGSQAPSSDQHVPVVVAELVAEVADDRPVRLLQVLAMLLAVVVVGLGDVERDERRSAWPVSHGRARRAATRGSRRRGRARRPRAGAPAAARGPAARTARGAWPPRARAGDRRSSAASRSGMVRVSRHDRQMPSGALPRTAPASCTWRRSCGARRSGSGARRPRVAGARSRCRHPPAASAAETLRRADRTRPRRRRTGSAWLSKKSGWPQVQGRLSSRVRAGRARSPRTR